MYQRDFLQLDTGCSPTGNDDSMSLRRLSCLGASWLSRSRASKDATGRRPNGGPRQSAACPMSTALGAATTDLLHEGCTPKMQG